MKLKDALMKKLTMDVLIRTNIMKKIVITFLVFISLKSFGLSDSIMQDRFLIDKREMKIHCDTLVKCVIYYGINNDLAFEKVGKDFDISCLDSLRCMDKNGETHYFLYLDFENGLDVGNFEFTLRNSPTGSKKPYPCYYNRNEDHVFFFSQKGKFDVFLRQERKKNDEIEYYWTKIHSDFGDSFDVLKLKISDTELKAAGFQIFLVKFKNRNGSFEVEIPWL